MSGSCPRPEASCSASQPLGGWGTAGQPEGLCRQWILSPRRNAPLRPRLLAVWFSCSSPSSGSLGGRQPGPLPPLHLPPRRRVSSVYLSNCPLPMCPLQVVVGKPKSLADPVAEKPSPRPRAWRLGTGHPPSPRCTQRATATAGRHSPTACGRTDPHLQVGVGAVRQAGQQNAKACTESSQRPRHLLCKEHMARPAQNWQGLGPLGPRPQSREASDEGPGGRKGCE